VRSTVNEGVGGGRQRRGNHIDVGVSYFHSFLTWFTARENIAVCAIATVVLVLHLLIIAKPTAMMFDEQYYVPAANSFLAGGELTNPEHPPLGKWLIAAGIFIFGDSAMGWRIPSVIFGVASIFIFYLICVRLTRKEVGGSEAITLNSPTPSPRHAWFTTTTFVPVFATFLFAAENLSFVQAHIAMLDVFYVTLMLLGFLLYLQGNYLSCGVVMGLSMLCKAMALLAILAVVLHWGLTRRHEVAEEIRRMLNTLRGKKAMSHYSALLDMGKLLISAAVVWVVLLPLLEYPASHQFSDPISRTIYMLGFHIEHAASSYTSPIASMPWTWVSSPTNIIYWPPNFAWVSGRWTLAIDSANPLYWAAISWNIWALILLSMLYLTYEVIRYRAVQHNIATFGLSWFFGVYVLLIPLDLATGRLMYTFYFYPAIPVVCLAIAWSVWKLWSVMRKEKKRRVIFLGILTAYLASTVVIFFLMSPYGGHLLFGVRI